MYNCICAMATSFFSSSFFILKILMNEERGMGGMWLYLILSYLLSMEFKNLLLSTQFHGFQ